jgi:magnesium chelatase subunit D
LIRLSSPGRKKRALFTSGPGLTAFSRPFKEGSFSDIALFPTLKTAAIHSGPKAEKSAFQVRYSDLKQRVRERKAGQAILFVMDASSSMGALGRMALTKGVVSHYFKESYRARHRLGLVTFRHNQCQLLLPFTSNIRLALIALEHLSVGGKTPLAQGILLGLRTLNQEKTKVPESGITMVVVSDGKPNVSLWGGDPLEEALQVAEKMAGNGITFIFLDTEDNPLAFGYGPDIARQAQGIYRPLSGLLRRR